MHARSSTVPFEQLLLQRLRRRDLLIGASAVVALATAASPAQARTAARETALSRVRAQRTDALALAPGYRHDLLIRFGDSLFAGTPDLTDAELRSGVAGALQGDLQQRRFGTNNDGIAFFGTGRNSSNEGLLCVNHEYVTLELAFAGLPATAAERIKERAAWIAANPKAVAWMQAAHGVSVLSIAQQRSGWQIRPGTPLTRRISATTPCELTGPARGHRLLRTHADPAGTRCLGTFANCSGGKTPWGTYLTAEENIEDYFGFGRSWAQQADDDAARGVHQRFAMPEQSAYGWEHADPRFDLRREPHEPFRFGWIVEIDPRNPQAAPRKRTALGRFSHEGANTILCKDQRVAAYMGDDERFEYLYKFITRDRFDPKNPAANTDLLDDGILHVARFDADGRGEWLPLTFSNDGPLGPSAGFHNHGDIVLDARRAADLLGATPMDRPEDVQPNPVTGRVYISCTRNTDRSEHSQSFDYNGHRFDRAQNPANPRPGNRYGHVLELIEADDDAAASRFHWNVFLLAGDPQAEGARLLTRYEDVVGGRARPQDTWFAGYADAAALSPIACPDNLGIDPQGRLWIVSDTEDRAMANNGCYVVPTTGPERGLLRQIVSAPTGAEVAGCEFTPDGRTLFLSIQHPGEGGTLENPVSHWPGGGDTIARSAVVAIRRDDGKAL